MASSNTKFKVENGLDVVGSANVSGTLRVEGDLAVGGNLLTALNLAGDLKPTTNNTLNLGSSLLRWGYLYANNVDIFSNTTIGDTLSGNNASFANVIATQNNAALGALTRRWDFYANNANLLTAGISGNATLANVTVSNTFTVASQIVANTTHLQLGNTQFSVNTGSKLAVVATGNSTYSNLTLVNDVSSIAGNVTFDTDTLTIDAVNNRIGLKTGIASLSANAVATVTGNVEFATSNTGVRFVANATVIASAALVANTTNNKFTFTTWDSGNTTVLGGYQFIGANGTGSQALLDVHGTLLQYKSANVAHAGNFGIYNVSGTRLGP